MFRKFALVLGTALCLCGYAYAESGAAKEGVQSFQQESGAWRRQAQSQAKILNAISDSVGKSAIANIIGAEQVFCYQVANRPADYSGYTLDGMAVTGFCGVINDELKSMIVEQLFSNAGNIDFNTSEQCVIKPRLMLRFMRGVDATDVLISAPCYSVAIFYAGKAKAYNFKPGAEILDVMVSSFDGQAMPFTSPALLNQLLPIGVPQSTSQQKAVNEQSKAQLPMKAKTSQAQQPVVEPKKTSGWNNIKLNVNK